MRTCHYTGWIRAALAFLVATMFTCATAGQTVVINEFMAANRSTITNSLGRTSDWIELYNASSNIVDLSGWHLTDNPGSPDKWKIPPGTFLDPFDYLLIYASGHDESVVGSELHASFQLDDAGEYLALIEPDAHTIAFEYSPAFPEQSADISFGLRPDTTDIAMLSTNTSYRYRMPTDGSLGLTWTAADFDDSAWDVGTGGLGHDWTEGNFDAHIQTVVPATKLPTAGVYLRHTFTLEEAGRVDVLQMYAMYDDGVAVYLNGSPVSLRNCPADPAWSNLASVVRSDEEAVYFSEFDLSEFSHLLLNGTNVLAVHMLNAEYSPRSSDLLFLATLDGLIFSPDVSGVSRYFHQPSPGRENAIGQQDFLQSVRFTVERGYVDAPFDLALSTDTPGARIRYTLDGSEPTVSNGVNYVGPVHIGETSPVRARAFKDHYEPSPVTTHTYLFVDDILHQSVMNSAVVNNPQYSPRMHEAFLSIRTLSIVTLRDHIFGPQGLYTNPQGRGELWERPISAEFIDPVGGDSEQIDCGLRIYGGASRGNTARKSWRMLFKSKYGPTKLKYKLFRESTATESFDTIILRGGYLDQFIKIGLCDSMVRSLQVDVGGVGSHSAFVHLFINGEYWGLYNPSERPDQAFCASYYPGVKEEWDAVNSNDPTGESLLDTWNAMLAAVALGVTDNERYQSIQGNHPDGTRNPSYPVHLDIENHINYMLSHIWAGTGDWPSHNWYAGGPRAQDTGWKFHSWDAEASLIIYSDLNRDVTTTSGPRYIFGALRQNPEFRLRFADRVRQCLLDGGLLTPEQTIPRFKAMADELDAAILADSARWGNEGTPGVWSANRDNILDTYLPQRTDIVLAQLKKASLYPSVAAPVFSQNGGVFADAFRLTIAASNTVYYTTDGRDPREYGTGAAVGTLYTAPIELTENVAVRARARGAAGVWSALTEAVFVAPHVSAWLRVSEVMAHPAPPPEGSPYTAGDFEFVEIANIGTAALNLEFLRFSDGIDFTFPAMSLGAGQRTVVVRNPDAFVTRYPNPLISIAGQYTGSLSDAGERVRLDASAAGPELAAFEYNDSREWPPQCDGAGHSLVPLTMDEQSSGSLNYGGNWRASATIGGSPGEADPLSVHDVVLNEVRAHTDYTNAALPQYDSNDWLELFNTGGETIALTNWYLSDNAFDLRKWAIPGTNVLASGAWKVFDEVTGFHNPTNTGFGLSKDGETVFLSYLPGTEEDRVADAVRFKAQERHVGLSRVPDGTGAWFPAPETPGDANGEARRDVVISEVMYHPAPTQEHPEDNTADEYIEIWNPLDEPVALWTNEGPWRIDGGVRYTFPTNVMLLPKESVVVTAIDPANPVARAAFLAVHGLSEGETRLFGPFSGKLSNRDDRVAVERPQGMDLPDTGIAWVIVDEVIYFDQRPWPDDADGTGHTLQRIKVFSSGNDPSSWSGAFVGTPGMPSAKVAISSPNNGITLFVPFSRLLTVSMDDEQLVGSVLGVEFLEGTDVLFADGDAPYEYLLADVTAPGTHVLYARLEDDGGTELSPPVSIHALHIDTVPGGVSQPTDVSAVLSGELSGSGSANITAYWGTSDGGTDRHAWQHSKPLGSQSIGTFATQVGGLDPSRTYYYRFHGQTVENESWSPGCGAFRTLPFTRWEHRMKITFAGYERSTALSNFPALIRMDTNIAGFAYSDFAHADGKDLRFADDSGLLALNHQIEEWNTNASSSVWVQIPTLASSNDYIYALWGNSNIVDAPASTIDGSTWDPLFAAVWHLDDSLGDASVNRVEASNGGSTPTDGIVGNGRHFDGTNDIVHLGVHRPWMESVLDHLSFSLWVNPMNAFDPGSPMGIMDMFNTNGFHISPNRGRWIYTVEQAAAPVHTIVSNEWQMITLQLDNNRAYGYWNDSGPVFIGEYPDFEPALDLVLGNRNGDTNFFLGELDELRMETVIRPPDWIWASYMTAARNTDFTRYEVVPVSDGDDDDDGLFDEWEVEHFGGLHKPLAAPEEDWDWDGFDNRSEYAAGTAPKGADDFFKIDIMNNASTSCVSFFARETDVVMQGFDRYYSLEVSTNLTPPAWEAVDGHTNILGQDREIVCTNGPPAPHPAFYRGRVWVQPR